MTRIKNDAYVGKEVNGISVIGYDNCKNALGKSRPKFTCICSCGSTFECRTDAILGSKTVSCGCKSGDLISQKGRLPNNAGAFNLLIRMYASGAKKRGLDFNLTIDEFKHFIYSNCYYCGSKPKESILIASSKSSPNRRPRKITYNGIDRVDNAVGYNIGNCVSCCSICNTAKSNLPLADFTNWIKKLCHHQKVKRSNPSTK